MSIQIQNSFLNLIGNTPLVELKNIFGSENFNFFGKLELFNPGGSIKDRAAYNMLKNALDNGKINQETTIIESSSGNLGIGLSQICSYLGLKFICVVDPKATRMNKNIIKAYGCEISYVSKPDPETGDFLSARIQRVKELLSKIPNSFWTNQYANVDNPKAHHQTMHEIVTALNGEVDYLFVAVSTTGTLRGCTEYLKQNNLKTKIIAVDAEGSILFDNKSSKRLIPGHGASRKPELFDQKYADDFVLVSDVDCIKGCRRLVKEEAIFAGGSSGGIISAIEKMKTKIPKNANVVAFIIDRGDRYIDTIYSDNWIQKHFGNNLI